MSTVELRTVEKITRTIGDIANDIRLCCTLEAIAGSVSNDAETKQKHAHIVEGLDIALGIMAKHIGELEREICD